MKRGRRGSGSSNGLHALFGAATPRKPNKFGAIKTTVYGIEFHSGKEAERYVVLRALADAGRIHGLCMQQTWCLTVGGLLVTKYVSDFEYLEDGVWVVEDVKGHRTREYIIKRKLMKAIHGITIRET